MPFHFGWLLFHFVLIGSTPFPSRHLTLRFVPFRFCESNIDINTSRRRKSTTSNPGSISGPPAIEISPDRGINILSYSRFRLSSVPLRSVRMSYICRTRHIRIRFATVATQTPIIHQHQRGTIISPWTRRRHTFNPIYRTFNIPVYRNFLSDISKIGRHHFFTLDTP